ncbi:MAG: hypothetical protein GX777_08675, partial [Fastidiosipila sp.]|nr:hypothetical protein [Fastidiosipila sp.]
MQRCGAAAGVTVHSLVPGTILCRVFADADEDYCVGLIAAVGGVEWHRVCDGEDER